MCVQGWNHAADPRPLLEGPWSIVLMANPHRGSALEAPPGGGGVSSEEANACSGGRHDDVLDLRHVAPGGGGGLIRTAPTLPGVEVRRVPVPPVVRWRDPLVRIVVLGRFVHELCDIGHVHLSPPTPARGSGS